jgi:hypothetical protein
MDLNTFITLLQQNPESINFADSIELIDALYAFTPTAFRNGQQHNDADQNNGSCKIFSFAQIHQLDELQTLNCFGEIYRAVRENPQGDDHANIRQFMQSGWSGIEFDAQALAPLTFT